MDNNIVLYMYFSSCCSTRKKEKREKSSSITLAENIALVRQDKKKLQLNWLIFLNTPSYK